MTKKAGWFPVANRWKWHYSDAGEPRSLCGGAMFLGRDDNKDDRLERSRDDCAKCRRLLDKRGAVMADGK